MATGSIFIVALLTSSWMWSVPSLAQGLPSDPLLQVGGANPDGGFSSGRYEFRESLAPLKKKELPVKRKKRKISSSETVEVAKPPPVE